MLNIIELNLHPNKSDRLILLINGILLEITFKKYKNGYLSITQGKRKEVGAVIEQEKEGGIL